MEQAKPLQPPQEKKSMEQLADMHMNMMKSHDKFENETRTSLNNQAAQLQNLEVQIGQMSSLLSDPFLGREFLATGRAMIDV